MREKKFDSNEINKKLASYFDTNTRGKETAHTMNFVMALLSAINFALA